jgi:hypothetical protein
MNHAYYDKTMKLVSDPNNFSFYSKTQQSKTYENNKTDRADVKP